MKIVLTILILSLLIFSFASAELPRLKPSNSCPSGQYVYSIGDKIYCSAPAGGVDSYNITYATWAYNQTNGISTTVKLVCDIDLVALTKKYQNFTYVGGIVKSNTTCI